MRVCLGVVTAAARCKEAGCESGPAPRTPVPMMHCAAKLTAPSSEALAEERQPDDLRPLQCCCFRFSGLEGRLGACSLFALWMLGRARAPACRPAAQMLLPATADDNRAIDDSERLRLNPNVFSRGPHHDELPLIFSITTLLRVPGTPKRSKEHPFGT